MARGRSKASRTPFLQSRRFVGALGKATAATMTTATAAASAAAAGLATRGKAAGSRKASRSSKSSRRADDEAPDSPPSPRRREIAALVLLGLTVFLVLAFATSYGGGNLCGPTGEWVAGLLLGAFGWAAWLIVACLGLWGGTLFARVQPDSFTVRVSGLVLCLVALSSLLANLSGNAAGHFPVGGVIGEYINTRLSGAAGLGNAGTLIVLVVLTLITFVLATDIGYYTSISAGVGWMRKRRLARMAAAAAAAGPSARVDAGELELEDEEAEPAAVEAGRGGKRASRRSLGEMLGRKKKDKAGGPDDSSLEPFAVLEGVPGASIPEAPVERPRARTAGAPARAPTSGPPAKAPAAPARAPAAAEPPERPGEPKKKAPVVTPPAAPPREAAASAAAAAAPANAPAPPGAGKAATPPGRTVPMTVKPSPPRIGTTDEPNELTKFGEPIAPTPVGPAPYSFPSEELLDKQETVDQEELDALLAAKTETLEKTLESFKIEARCVEIQKGPVISMFEMELGPGIKVERVRSLEDDLAIALRARTVRIVAPIPGKNTIGIEVPNPLREVVRMKPLLRCKEYTDGKYALPIFLGRDASGAPMIVDLAKMPHLLVAGATGSGKSVCLNSILASFLYTRTPEQVKLILIDPKMVELSQFANAPHLACPVISDMKRAPGILDWAIVKMEERYRLLAQAGQRNIYGYNKLGKDGLRPHFAERVDDPEFPHFMPFIVIVIDELADLMLTAAKEVETSITRLAAKSRAVGIHLIVATQRPSTNVITGLIKANLPTRIGFMVSSKIDSRVILDENGAEQLLGEGDMLVMSPASTSLVRGQGAYLSEEEVKRIMEHVKTAGGPAYVPELVQRKGENSRDPDEEDELYDAAARFVFSTERGSASLLQRKFAIGYTRASRLIDMMAEEGVLGEYKGSQARELTMTLADWIALKPQARGTAAEGEFDASHAAADQGGADPRGAAPAPEIEAEAGAEAGGSAAAARDAAEDEADDDDGGDSEEIEISLDDDDPPPPPKSEGRGKRKKG